MQFSVGANGHCAKSCCRVRPDRGPNHLKPKLLVLLLYPPLQPYCSLHHSIYIHYFTHARNWIFEAYQFQWSPFRKQSNHRAIRQAMNKKQTTDARLSKYTKYENQCSVTVTYKHNDEQIHTHTHTHPDTSTIMCMRLYTAIHIRFDGQNRMAMTKREMGSF